MINFKYDLQKSFQEVVYRFDNWINEDEERFQSSNKFWICDKLFDVGDNKVRNHCHITGKYRGSAHWSCHVNIKLAQNVSVKFPKLKGYDSHLVMQVLWYKTKCYTKWIRKIHGLHN